MHKEAGDGLSADEIKRRDSNEDSSVEDNDHGIIRIHNDVIATIVRMAVMKVAGVAGLSGSMVDGLSGILGRKNANSGIELEATESGIVVEINVVMEYGVRIPQVSWQLQTNVCEAVENMTGRKVNAVNIVVQGIRLSNTSPRSDTGEDGN